MAQAPAGSCLADPTAAGCPAVSAVVAVAEQTSAQTAPEETSVQTTLLAGCDADAARPGVVERSDNRLWAFGAGFSNDCASGVTYQELYVTLFKYLDGRWNQLVVGSRTNYGPEEIGKQVYARCNHNTYRRYMTEAYVYSEQNGTGYAAADREINERVRCPQ